MTLSEDQRHERTEKAKHILRVQQAVLTHWLDGLTAQQSAGRLGISDATVERLRRILQLTRGQAHRGGVKPLGRTSDFVVEVRR